MREIVAYTSPWVNFEQVPSVLVAWEWTDLSMLNAIVATTEHWERRKYRDEGGQMMAGAYGGTDQRDCVRIRKIISTPATATPDVEQILRDVVKAAWSSCPSRMMVLQPHAPSLARLRRNTEAMVREVTDMDEDVRVCHVRYGVNVIFPETPMFESPVESGGPQVVEVNIALGHTLAPRDSHDVMSWHVSPNGIAGEEKLRVALEAIIDVPSSTLDHLHPLARMLAVVCYCGIEVGPLRAWMRPDDGSRRLADWQAAYNRLSQGWRY